MIATWFVMEDGSVVDPSDIAPDSKGVLRDKNGLAVKMRGDVPHSRSVDVDAERIKTKSKPSTFKPQTIQPKDMKPEEPKQGYFTRQNKAD